MWTWASATQGERFVDGEMPASSALMRSCMRFWCISMESFHLHKVPRFQPYWQVIRGRNAMPINFCFLAPWHVIWSQVQHVSERQIPERQKYQKESWPIRGRLPISLKRPTGNLSTQKIDSGFSLAWNFCHAYSKIFWEKKLNLLAIYVIYSTLWPSVASLLSLAWSKESRCKERVKQVGVIASIAQLPGWC